MFYYAVSCYRIHLILDTCSIIVVVCGVCFDMKYIKNVYVYTFINWVLQLWRNKC